MHPDKRLSNGIRHAFAGLLVVGLSIMLFPPDLAAQLSDNLEIHGFLMGNFTRRLSPSETAEPPVDFMLAEERLRLDVTAWSNSVDATAEVRADFFHDAVTGQFEVDVREAYLDYIAGNFDFRIGRQIATWGVGDLLFVNDVFPKNWVSFFSGRPLEYLRTGVDGLRTRFSSSALNVEVLVSPFFTPDNFPTAERFIFSGPSATITLRDRQKPEVTSGNTELALRLYRRVGNFDVSFYAYRGFSRTPGILPDPSSPERGTRVYPHLSGYGASVQRNSLGGVLSLEAGYYDPSESDTHDVLGVPESQKRFLVGYQKEIQRDFNLGVQYLAESGAHQWVCCSGQLRRHGNASPGTARETSDLETCPVLFFQPIRPGLSAPATDLLQVFGQVQRNNRRQHIRGEAIERFSDGSAKTTISIPRFVSTSDRFLELPPVLTAHRGPLSRGTHRPPIGHRTDDPARHVPERRRAAAGHPQMAHPLEQSAPAVPLEGPLPTSSSRRCVDVRNYPEHHASPACVSEFRDGGRILAGSARYGLSVHRIRSPSLNSRAERFIQTLLREWAYFRVCRMSIERTTVLPIYLIHYNQHRQHGSLNYKPPITRLPGVHNVAGIHS